MSKSNTVQLYRCAKCGEFLEVSSMELSGLWKNIGADDGLASSVYIVPCPKCIGVPSGFVADELDKLKYKIIKEAAGSCE